MIKAFTTIKKIWRRFKIFSGFAGGFKKISAGFARFPNIKKGLMIYDDSYIYILKVLNDVNRFKRFKKIPEDFVKY